MILLVAFNVMTILWLIFIEITRGPLPSLASHPSLFEWLDIRPFNTLIKGSNPIHTTFKGTGRDLLIGTYAFNFLCEIFNKN